MHQGACGSHRVRCQVQPYAMQSRARDETDSTFGAVACRIKAMRPTKQNRTNAHGKKTNEKPALGTLARLFDKAVSFDSNADYLGSLAGQPNFGARVAMFVLNLPQPLVV